MAQQNINIGTPNGQDGEFVRDAFDKTQDNFTELYTITPKTGSSSTNPNSDPDAATLVLTYPNTPLYWVLTGGINPIRYKYDFETSTWLVDEQQGVDQDNLVRIIDLGNIGVSNTNESTIQTAVNSAFDALSQSIRTKAENENILVVVNITEQSES